MEITGSATVGGGRYRLLSRLGRGDDAVVYEAMAQHSGARCALKVLLPHAARRANQRARFESGAQALQRLRHPNLVQVSEVVTDGPLPFLAMELVPGGTLAGWIERSGPMPPWQAVRCALQVAAALSTTHEAGIVHGEVSPHDVLLATDGTCRLGIFRILRGADRSLDPRIDVAGLGRTLWTLMIGRSPPASASAAAMSEVPAPLRGVILRSVAPQLEQRPRTVTALAQQLQAQLARLPQERVPELGLTLVHGQPDAFGEIAILLDTNLDPAPPEPSPPQPPPQIPPPPPPKPPARPEPDEEEEDTFLDELANVVHLALAEVARTVLPLLTIGVLLGAGVLGLDHLRLRSAAARFRSVQGELDAAIVAEQPVLQGLVELGAEPARLQALWSAWASAPDAQQRALAAQRLVDELQREGARLRAPGIEQWHEVDERLERLERLCAPLIEEQRTFDASSRSILQRLWGPEPS